MTSIWWIRRDLRLRDQPALKAAMEQGPVVPVFVMVPGLLRKAAPLRREFLIGCLRSLDLDLSRRGGRLIVRTGSPSRVLPALMKETQAQAIIAEEDFTPYARRRDAAVGRDCNLQLIPGQTVHHPAKLLKGDGQPYVVYTPYSKEWKRRLPDTLALLPAPRRIEVPDGIASEPLIDEAVDGAFQPGEVEANRRLNAFMKKGIVRYGEHRDRMDLDATSGLSPYLRFGVISMRTAVAAALEAQAAAPDAASRRSAETWLNELIWREFYVQILYHFPRVQGGSFRSSFAHVRWRRSVTDLEAWKQGLTGVPVVDAGMRQLRATGWMHNRARMITASYLVKDLLISWQEGERWFMDNLVDGDPASNNGGWQWTAGTGTDAAPYFRIFNPVLQGKKFDPQGDYVRRWVPELAHLPAETVHAPWERGLSVPGYPQKPIIDHASAIRRTRLAYEAARDNMKAE